MPTASTAQEGRGEKNIRKNEEATQRKGKTPPISSSTTRQVPKPGGQVTAISHAANTPAKVPAGLERAKKRSKDKRKSSNTSQPSRRRVPADGDTGTGRPISPARFKGWMDGRVKEGETGWGSSTEAGG